jgi:hypothetical protein
MEWLFIFLERLLAMWTVDGDVSRPGLVRRYAPAYARKAPAARRYTGPSHVDRTVSQPGYAWFPPAKARLRCAPRAPEGPPDG